MSTIHPGSSIVFDAANLQNNDDENEMLQEELRKQQELRELLSAELTDDLLEDDHSSVNDSRQSYSHDASNEQTEQAPVDITPNQHWIQNNHVSAVPSTGEQAHNTYYGHAQNGYHGYDNTQFSYNHNFGNGQQQYYDPSYGAISTQSQQWQNFGNGNIYQVDPGGIVQYHPYVQDARSPGQVIHENDDRDKFMYADQRQVEGREDYGEMMDGNRAKHQHHYMQLNQQNKKTTAVPATSAPTPSSLSSKASYRQSYPPQNGQHEIVDRRLKSGRKSYLDSHNSSVEISSPKHDAGNLMNLHDEINQACGDPQLDTSGRQMTQLEILYKARGKRIDELTKELDDLKADSARQNRMLNHQLAMTKDEKCGMGSSLEKSQQLVCEKDREINDLKGKLEAQSVEVEGLKSAKNELVAKIQVTERTIEGLHEQLTQLSNLDTVERAREQHDAVLSATTQRHEMQVLELTTQLDEYRQELGEKTEECQNVQTELSKVSRDAEQTLLEKTETINRLTKSLEEAQKQCQNLLAGSNENAMAKHQVSDLLSERKCNEEEIAYLRMQVSDFEEHLKLYENALQLGAGGFRSRHVRGGSMTDSISELMGGASLVRKLDWKTPPPQKVKDFVSGGEDELIDGLRQELQRALKCNKTKRDEITKLKAQCSGLEEESSHWRARADEAQSQLRMNVSAPSHKIDESEDDDGAAKIDELGEQLRTANEEIERLEEACADVKQRMADMIHEHDVDKQNSVERCERALMQLHVDSKQALRDEIVAEYEQRMYELSVDHDAKMREISTDMEQLQQELYDVKQSYVHVCAEKDSIQSSLQQELTEQFEKERENILTEHQLAINKLESMLDDLEKEMAAKITEERENHIAECKKQAEKLTNQLKEEWENKNENEFSQKMETQIALAKVSWFEDFAESKQNAITEAIKIEEDKWSQSVLEMKATWENQKRMELEEKLEEIRISIEQEKNEEIERLHEEFQSDKETAVKTAQCMAELNKNLQTEDREQEIERKIRDARDTWKKESDSALENAREIWEAEQCCKINTAVEEARKKSQKELEIEMEKQNSIMEKAVLEMKKVCDMDKHNTLKQKCLDMEMEIKKLQEQHKKDYEKFVDDHKRTLASFLEREKSRSRPKTLCRDACSQVKFSEEMHDYEKDKWMAEKRELEIQNKDDIARMQKNYQDKSEVLRKEIQELTLEKHNVAMKLERAESQKRITVETATLEHVKESSQLKIENERLKSQLESVTIRMTEEKEKHKDDMDKLKMKIRDEYRKWKKERSLLVEKLEQLPSTALSNEKTQEGTAQTAVTCQFCQDSQQSKDRLLKTKDEAMRKAIAEMSNIYTETLTMIKDEMMAYIANARVRTRETISRDRKRTATRIKSHYANTMKKLKDDKQPQIPQSFQKLKVYESDSDTSSLAPTKDDALIANQSHKVSPTTPTNALDQLYSHRTEPKDPILDRFSNQNKFHQYPTKLPASSEEQSEKILSRPIESRDSQFYSVASLQPVTSSYSMTSAHMISPHSRPLETHESPRNNPYLFNHVRKTERRNDVNFSPTRSRSDEFVSDITGNAYRRLRNATSPFGDANKNSRPYRR